MYNPVEVKSTIFHSFENITNTNANTNANVNAIMNLNTNVYTNRDLCEGPGYGVSEKKVS